MSTATTPRENYRNLFNAFEQAYVAKNLTAMTEAADALSRELRMFVDGVRYLETMSEQYVRELKSLADKSTHITPLIAHKEGK